MLPPNLKMSMNQNIVLNFIRKVSTRNLNAPMLNCVPKHSPAISEDISSLQNFIRESTKILILTGAGISTESGIPDYRSEDVGLYARSNHRPVQFQEFLKSAAIRQRYWARNYLGWFGFSRNLPNGTHEFVRDLEKIHGKVSGVVTQNVDGLHKKAGSGNVIELHGTAFRVVCLQCGNNYERAEIQRQLMETNPELREEIQMIRPDGDVEISQDKIRNFRPPFCEACNGILKPDIIFFGDNVPKQRVEAVRSWVAASDSVLVLGSSLSVFSGYRIILQAVDEKKKVAIVNIGPTRADKLADLKISAKCGEILPKVM